MIAHPEVLVQLRDELVADVEGFNDRRRQHKSIRKWLGCEGPPESTGRGMQEEICRRTREAPKAPIVGEVSVYGIQLMRHEKETWIQDYAGT